MNFTNLSLTALDGPRIESRVESLGKASGAANGGNKAKSLMLFIHGYGASGNDLISIGSMWSPSLPETEFFSPHAIEAIPSFPMGRQWFAINPALSSIGADDYSGGTEKAGTALLELLETERERLDIDYGSILLFGFSQGGMLALHLASRTPSALAGVISFAGKLTTRPVAAGPRPPIFLAHGDFDNVVPYSHHAKSKQELEGAGFNVEAHTSPMLAHSISPRELDAALLFARRCLAG